MKIPYGVSNYYSIKTKNYLYVDKTWGIEELENEGSPYLVALRPRRFGKSLFISTLENYYDIKKADNFDILFNDTYIGKNKTESANSLYILRFEFAGLQQENLMKHFAVKVRGTLEAFNGKYGFPIDMAASKFNSDYAEIILFEYLSEVSRYVDNNIYILIDEYDHFANNLLQSGYEKFSEATSSDGFVRHFYEVIKDFCGSGVIDRLFITGVTSLTLDSFTSGFNITKNISDREKYNDLFGFSEEEVRDILTRYQISTEHLDLLKYHYNGYRFNPYAENTVFNSNMVLYFVDTYLDGKRVPATFTDPNINSDYVRVTSMFSLFKDENQRVEVLEGIIDNNPIRTNIVTNFNLLNFGKEDFYSLLYYLGLLTIIGPGLAYDAEMQTPNAVIRDIYYQYYSEYLKLPDTIDAIEDLASGNFKAFNTAIEEILKTHADEDFKSFNEARLKSIFLSCLSGEKQKLYLIKSEYPVEGRRIDIALMSRYTQCKNYLIEIKYVPKNKATEHYLQSIKDEAIEQIKEYLKLNEFAEVLNISGLVYVICKNEIVYFEEIFIEVKK